METPFVNIHTHKATGRHIELVNTDNFSSAPEDEFVSAGLHPWMIGQSDHLHTMQTLEQWCKQNLIAAIGEIGLDRCIKTSIDEQKIVFEQQLEIAEHYSMPVIIHCVRAYSDFMQILKQKPKVPFVFHGFNGNGTTAKQLIANKAFLSFGEALLKSNNLQTVFTEIPNDCIFLETDTKQTDIIELYQFAASLKNISTDELKNIIFNNLKKIFGKKCVAIG